MMQKKLLAICLPYVKQKPSGKQVNTTCFYAWHKGFSKLIIDKKEQFMNTAMAKVSVASVEDFSKLVNIISQIGLFSSESKKQLLQKKDVAEWLRQFVDVDDNNRSYFDNIYDESPKLHTDLFHIHDFTKQHMEYGDSDFDDLRMK